MDGALRIPGMGSIFILSASCIQARAPDFLTSVSIGPSKTGVRAMRPLIALTG